MFSLTVQEAAKLLGVSPARTYQLLNENKLEGERIGRTWLIFQDSVEQRVRQTPRPGRVPKISPSSESVQAFTLMNRTHEVLSFRYDQQTDTFFDASQIYDVARAPLGVLSPRGKTASAAALQYWWRHRSIPQSREGIQAKLAELGYKAPFEIPFASFGLSMSDQYWIRPYDSDLQWEEINYFDNPFDVLEETQDWLADVGLDTPDNTSEGELPKKWVIEQGKRLLVKGGSGLNQQPCNEVVATNLYERLLSRREYVPYELRSLGGRAVSVCESFISSDEEYIPAYYVNQIMRKPNHHNDHQHYIECCVRLGVENIERSLSKMIVCDDILANTDRHWRNFGLIRNVETLEYRVAPIFDSGTSLWLDATLSALRGKDYSFHTKPFYEDANRQLRLVNDYSWLDVSALEEFPQSAFRVLSQNPELVDRAALISEGIQGRIERIVRLL